jgi:hypothetical protein
MSTSGSTTSISASSGPLVSLKLPLLGIDPGVPGIVLVLL